MTIVNEFIDALAIEIEVLKEGKGGSIVTVYNGELIRQTLELFIYQFTLENFLIVLDGTPASIEVNGKEYECEIISVTGQQVQISLNNKLSDRISIARIITNTWYLLERLRKKYEDNLGSQSRFINSNKLFLDENTKIDGGNFNPTYSINGKEPPNPNQHKAIESSINDFLSIIWGPPGTGKTRTIANAIESHLSLGRKVLLLSHSNNAVDQALLKVACQVKNTFYKDSQLVRLGTPKQEMIVKFEKENCSLVLIDNIAKFRSKELIREKDELNNFLERLQDALQSLRKIEELSNLVTESKRQIDSVRQEIKTQELKRNTAKDEVSQIQQIINDLQEKLIKVKNFGFVKRVFTGLDPTKIEAKIKTATLNLAVKVNQLQTIEENLIQLNKTIQPLKDEFNRTQSDLSKNLSRIGKTPAEALKDLYDYENRVTQIQNRIVDINKAIEEIKIKILSDSKLVATTLTKSYISKEIEAIEFDILIVDEVSMAPMPMLYWAASKIKKGITIVGDFMQLPPICVSNDDLVFKWLGRSIFNELKISERESAERRVQLLNEQYRMHPLISELVNNRIYKGRLTDGDNVIQKILFDTVSGNSTINIIDTSNHNPWCSQFEAGGRFNLINAIICVSLVEKLIPSIPENKTIGIITPYRNQARLIQKIAEDKKLLPNIKIRINTIHSFQGGEETVIILDSVEGEGAKKWSMINEYNNVAGAQLLLNVALTRAEMKLYVVANCSYIKNSFKSDTFFVDILRHIIQKGKVVPSNEIISDLKDENFDYWISHLNSFKDRPENFGESYTHQDFWPAFYNDLANSERELIIFSPFMTSERFGKLHLMFSELLLKGINIYVITLPPNEQPPIMQGTTAVMVKIKEMGIILKFRPGMHEKIALIDNKIKWFGSLNILSHNTKKEYMERIYGESSAKELYDKFHLEDLLMNQNINGELCPLCKINGRFGFILPKYSRKNRQMFYGCSDYPKCDFTANIKARTFDDLNFKQSKSHQQKNKSQNNSSTKSSTQAPKDNGNKDLFGNTVNGEQWETKLNFWSTVQLPGYKYAKKKNAWYKGKR